MTDQPHHAKCKDVGCPFGCVVNPPPDAQPETCVPGESHYVTSPQVGCVCGIIGPVKFEPSLAAKLEQAERERDEFQKRAMDNYVAHESCEYDADQWQKEIARLTGELEDSIRINAEQLEDRTQLANENAALREVVEAAIYTSSKTTYDDVREALLRQDKIVKAHLAALAAKEGK